MNRICVSFVLNHFFGTISDVPRCIVHETTAISASKMAHQTSLNVKRARGPLQLRGRGAL